MQSEYRHLGIAGCVVGSMIERAEIRQQSEMEKPHNIIVVGLFNFLCLSIPIDRKFICAPIFTTFAESLST